MANRKERRAGDSLSRKEKRAVERLAEVHVELAIRAFERDRDLVCRAVLERDDISLMEIFAQKYLRDDMKVLLNSNSPENKADVLRRMAYKMIPEINSFTPEERNQARQWLRDHNSSGLFDK